jgi:hypothetical protein
LARLISISRKLRRFLRSAGPRGFTAYNAEGMLIGMFQDEAAAVEAITAAST